LGVEGRGEGEKRGKDLGFVHGPETNAADEADLSQEPF
jgi:hypothetical protein